MMRRTVLGGALLLFAMSVQAQTRAWLDSNQASVGQELLLNLETEQATAKPDLTPLMQDFSLADQTSSRSARWSNGSVSTKTTYAIALLPRREGRVVIPAIRVGNEFSKPIVLQVAAGNAPSVAAQANADAFLETIVDQPQPYVQQSVGLLVRFNYSDAINSGSFGIDAPEGASLQQVGEDRYSTRVVGGREYKVAERSYVLVPERSGRLSIPAPQFQGRRNTDLFGQMFGGAQTLRLAGQARVLEVRPQPANAPQPWLPLRDLRLRYVGTTAQVRQGEAATLTIEATAEGATRAQLPELPIPKVTGGQVFADTPQFDERFVNGVPQVKLTQRYSVVAEYAGELRVAPAQMAWFDVKSNTAQQANLPPLSVQVTGSASAGVTDTGAVLASPGAVPQVSSVQDGLIPAPWWPRLATLFALLWLATLVWAVSRRSAGQGSSISGGGALNATPVIVAAPWHSLNDLRKALDSGSLDEVGDVLRGMHAPPLPDMDAVSAALAEGMQREAVDQLRRARWADGDGSAARIALRNAFRDGPVWRAVARPTVEVLAPLYPK